MEEVDTLVKQSPSPILNTMLQHRNIWEEESKPAPLLTLFSLPPSSLPSSSLPPTPLIPPLSPPSCLPLLCPLLSYPSSPSIPVGPLLCCRQRWALGPSPTGCDKLTRGTTRPFFSSRFPWLGWAPPPPPRSLGDQLGGRRVPGFIPDLMDLFGLPDRLHHDARHGDVGDVGWLPGAPSSETLHLHWPLTLKVPCPHKPAS